MLVLVCYTYTVIPSHIIIHHGPKTGTKDGRKIRNLILTYSCKVEEGSKLRMRLERDLRSFFQEMVFLYADPQSFVISTLAPLHDFPNFKHLCEQTFIEFNQKHVYPFLLYCDMAMGQNHQPRGPIPRYLTCSSFWQIFDASRLQLTPLPSSQGFSRSIRTMLSSVALSSCFWFWRNPRFRLDDQL